EVLPRHSDGELLNSYVLLYLLLYSVLDSCLNSVRNFHSCSSYLYVYGEAMTTHTRIGALSFGVLDSTVSYLLQQHTIFQIGQGIYLLLCKLAFGHDVILNISQHTYHVTCDDSCIN